MILRPGQCGPLFALILSSTVAFELPAQSITEAARGSACEKMAGAPEAGTAGSNGDGPLLVAGGEDASKPGGTGLDRNGDERPDRGEVLLALFPVFRQALRLDAPRAVIRVVGISLGALKALPKLQDAVDERIRENLSRFDPGTRRKLREAGQRTLRSLKLDPILTAPACYSTAVLQSFDRNIDNALSRSEIHSFLANCGVGNLFTRRVMSRLALQHFDLDASGSLSKQEIEVFYRHLEYDLRRANALSDSSA